ncbi:MAG: DedA family protein [Bacteroidota bacterium]|jgi:membrane protein DedA with SNARE-associated domain|nr:DedA family protein [Bacteroidota bacterium]
MLEQTIAYLSQVDTVWIYAAVFFISYIENIFPPFPSDVVVVFAGSLVAIGTGSVPLTLMLATGGSTLGFMSMYWIGDQFGDRVLEAGKLQFISRDLVHRVESWFRRYGYWVVIANRFLAGTRAVISFVTGMSELNFATTSVLSAASALLWNAILLYLGYIVGDNWRRIGDYLDTYSLIVTIILVLALAIWGAITKFKKRRMVKQT